MGVLAPPVYLAGTQILSGDVIRFTARGWRRLFIRPFLALVDIRDRSVPYLVRRRGKRVWKIPLQGASICGESFHRDIYRLPGIDQKTGSTIAAAAAERMGERIHHSSYDCGRTARSDEELVRESYLAVEVEVRFNGELPGAPLEPVQLKGGSR